MRNIIGIVIMMFSSLGGDGLLAQSERGSGGIENVIVEVYHIFEKNDQSDSNGQTLPEGTVTYRVFVDMKEGYTLHAVYGISGHPLEFKTSTQFYNHIDWGSATGNEVSDRRIDRVGVAFDSWLTLGAATRRHIGIPLAEDDDGSILTESFPGNADGLTYSEAVPSIIEYGIQLDIFDEAANSGVFHTEDGALAVLGGIKGTSEKNQVLIAQLTTDGQLSFEINLQVSNPDCKTENYVARNPVREEIITRCLRYPHQ